MVYKLLVAFLFLSAASPAVQGQEVSTYWNKGTQVVAQTVGGVTVQAYILQGSYFEVLVRVINNTDRPVDVQPQLFSFTETSPKNVELKQMSERDLQKSVSRYRFWGSLLFSVASATATQTSTVTTTSGGYSATSVVRTPDYAEQARLAESQHALDESAHSVSKQINEAILRRTTLYPNDSLTGKVFYKRASKLQGAVLTASVGGRVFSLPFGDATPASVAMAVRQQPEANLGSATPVPATAVQPQFGGGLGNAVPASAAPLSLASLGIAGNARSIYGFSVTAVAANSPAEHAKVAVGDLIVAVNGTPVRNEDDILAMLPPLATTIQVTITKPYWQSSQTELRRISIQQ
jgi:hypothetical protein